MAPVDRVRAAYQRRAQTDYYCNGPGLNIFLIIITCGIFGYYLFYQLMRRDRDHSLRRYELLDAANTFAWDKVNAQGLADELRPAFERNATNLDVLRRLTMEFRDPVVWLVIAIFARSIGEIVGYIFMDQDLGKHDRAEGAIEAELAAIFTQLGQPMQQPDPSRVKGDNNYVGRVIASIATCGIYLLWWTYDVQVDWNRHFEQNWPSDDAIAGAVEALA